MLTHLAAALGVLGLLTVAPGPDMAVVTRRGVDAGTRDALLTVGGIASGLLLWGALSVLGLAAVFAASATAHLVVQLLGAAYLLFLGGQALWQNRPSARLTPLAAEPAKPGHPWRTGLGCNLLNPKIAVSYTGLLPTLAPPELPGATGMTVLVLCHVALTVAWLGGYALLLARAGPVFRRPGVRRAVGRTTGVVLIGFGLAVATGGG
ncbi:LysE family translocator [Streptomyces sp. SDT5-1]|uniref:LysE family translocator n=1 Tax=Streptomyces sp. SDT5-1 TaxID=3406418 RepID=UPI003FD3961A